MIHHRRRLPLLLLALLAGCSPASRRGGTVLFASGADLQSINPLLTVHPLARQVQRYVLLTTLARNDSTLTPRPYLAQGWTWSPDRRTLTVSLHAGIPWHDGVPTTARDVVWTITTGRDPRTGYPRQSELAAITGLEAPDDTTVRVRFDAPQPGFPDVLTDLAILPAHLLDSVPPEGLRRAAWNRQPVGNGPFRFVAHEPNRRWVFEANPGFPAVLGGPPRLERLIVVVVDEPMTKLAALTSGELDFAGIQPAHAAFVRRNPALEVRSYPLLFTYGLVLNTRRPPFDEPAVRRAVALALDRREIVDGFVYGFGVPAEGPVPPDAPGYASPPPQPHDLEAARALLRGRTIRFELLSVGSGEAALEQLVQAQLARAGFQVTLRLLELSAYLDRVYGGSPTFDAALLGAPGDPGLGYLGPLAELAGMRAPRDPRAAQAFFADSLPVVFLYHARGVQGVSRRVRGVHFDVRGELATVAQWWTE